MIRIAFTRLAMVLLSAGLLYGESSIPDQPQITHEPIKPLPATLKLDRRKVALGRSLFHEPLLSRDGTVSCSTCHDLSKGGTSHSRQSLGIDKRPGAINAPTVFNCGFNFKQFWDGRAGSLEEQLDGPILSPNEMDSTWNNIVAKLSSSTSYAEAFREIYLEEIQVQTIKNALAEFERSLITPNSRFDRFLNGDSQALTAEEQQGYRKFKSYGCASCHQGINIGGNMFEPLGAMADYFGDRGHVTKADYGRFNVTGSEKDRFVFKVPSLRNVALTAPYFHDGSAETLEQAVSVMATYQLGEPLTAADIAQIVTFLKTLTGEYEGRPL